MSVGHWRFNGCQCPNLNLSQLSESESDANSTHSINSPLDSWILKSSTPSIEATNEAKNPSLNHDNSNGLFPLSEADSDSNTDTNSFPM